MQSFAPHSRQITIQHLITQFFYKPDALPDAQPTVKALKDILEGKMIGKPPRKGKDSTFLIIHLRKKNIWKSKNSQRQTWVTGIVESWKSKKIECVCI